MKEGWLTDDYLVIFDDNEVAPMTDRYGIAGYLADFSILGLRGWDDFIVRDSAGRTFTVPVVPLNAAGLSPFEMPPSTASLRLDQRFTGKIKWYVQPIVFGGDPKPGANMIWLPIDQHQEAVKWWNNKYKELVGNGGVSQVSSGYPC